jgi:hypothetical protein
MRHRIFSSALIFLVSTICPAQSAPLVALDRAVAAMDFPIVANGHATPIFVDPQNPQTVRVVAEAFADDVQRVSGVRPEVMTEIKGALPDDLIVVGALGHSPEIDRLVASHKLDVSTVAGKWESAVTAVIPSPQARRHHMLVIAGSDRRGAAYALFALSRAMGVSPWYWWADVPVTHHAAVYVRPGVHVQASPSVQYRGIFFNDEDWGFRPWASKKMDPTVDDGKGNIGPNAYAHVFELLLRLHANSLWPAMHPGSLAFNAVPGNAKLADEWGIVMGSSHSEALLRNNVGEWNEKTDGPWNYQVNSAAMKAYWDKRLVENGKYENFYTVGLRGVHDSGLEAKGSPQVKAKLVEDVMAEQQKLLAARVNPDLTKVPQIIWLYKESLDLYRVGMKVPDDVTLGWTDDNYGYIRELPDAAEQKRAGGSGIYYHISYWGSPHDYLWLCTTPPALIQEEMTKAYDHNARKYWILNVGDLKPAEIDIDYFMQLASDEPAMAKVGQREWLTQWFGEQFPAMDAAKIADIVTRDYALNFIRKPEFMGFNGYNDGVKRTEFNPLAWPSDGERDQNRARAAEWSRLRDDAAKVISKEPSQDDAAALFELVGYPVEAAAAMNEKFLATDLTYLDAYEHKDAAMDADAARAQAAYDTIQKLTAKYNGLEDGKWDGMMSDAPRERHVFEMPKTATAADVDAPLPAAWGAGSAECQHAGVIRADAAQSSGFVERNCAVSINAAHFVRKSSGNLVAQWHVLTNLGISGDSVVFGEPGRAPVFGPLMTGAAAQIAMEGGQFPWLEYDFTTVTNGPATLALHLLPTFSVDSQHTLRYAVALDGGAPVERDASGSAGKKSAGAGDGPSDADWPQNVLRNSAIDTIELGPLTPGKHTLRLLYRDPGVVFEHIVVTFAGAPPAYPVPPETQ